MKLSRSQILLACIGILALQAIVLLAMGHEPICSSENSQHISDWYSPSHIIHGFIFYGLLWLLSRRWPMSFGTRLILALGIEASWELIENTDYLTIAIAGPPCRSTITATVSSTRSATLFMVFGFFLASRLPIWLTIAVVRELVVGYMIRDNLTLNVLMLLWPVQSILDWQPGG
jgi:Protein of unknown function (DUF2585)